MQDLENRVIRLTNSEDSRKFTFSAIDGSFYCAEDFSEKFCYVVAVSVEGEVYGKSFRIKEFRVKDELRSTGDEDEDMGKMEYELANSSSADIVLMDRLISFDIPHGLSARRNTLAITKDYRGFNEGNLTRRDLSSVLSTPWILPLKEEGNLKRGFFRLVEVAYPFYYESNLDWSERDILIFLLSMGQQPIPEALGYNYPLFLADKACKYYRKLNMKKVDISRKETRYRDLRSIIEGKRRGGNRG